MLAADPLRRPTISQFLDAPFFNDVATLARNRGSCPVIKMTKMRAGTPLPRNKPSSSSSSPLGVQVPVRILRYVDALLEKDVQSRVEFLQKLPQVRDLFRDLFDEHTCIAKKPLRKRMSPARR